MRHKGNSVELLPDLRARMVRVRPGWRWLYALAYALAAAWRRIRVRPLATRLLGPQYRRSRDLLEIDITYTCNLACPNCNRSIPQAADTTHLSVARLAEHVDEWIGRGHRWRRIRVLGGEPTLHPEFEAIIRELLRYRAWEGACLVEVVTNGHGPRVRGRLDQLPDEVLIDDSQKAGTVEPWFRPFAVAPIDDPRWAGADFSNACAVARDCGVGLTPTGYYPCAVAGGIDRLLGPSAGALGRSELPPAEDDLLEEAAALCRLCGRFTDGHFVPRALREPLLTQVTSPTWARIYAEVAERRRARRGGP